MLKNAVMFAGSALAIALILPIVAPKMMQVGETPAATPPVAQSAPPVALAEAAPSAPVDGYREKSLLPDRGSQYWVDALIDGETVHMLVDTGATMVTISADLADRLGLTPDPRKPKWRMHTANGDSVASPVTLKTVDLGSIYMRDVEALIVERNAGDVNLLGSSFLKRLASVEQRNGMLILRQ
jgi:aspartyl protease family protein